MGLAEFEAQELYLKQLQVRRVLLNYCLCSTAVDATTICLSTTAKYKLRPVWQGHESSAAVLQDSEYS
jgi:hypothetical protein